MSLESCWLVVRAALQTFSVTALCALTLLIFGGCGQVKPPEKTFAVSGSVTLETRPVPFATLEFVPQRGGSARTAAVVDGKFEMPENLGLPAGAYHVRIRPYAPEIEELEALPAEKRQAVVASRKQIPEQYAQDGKLTAQVRPDQPATFSFNMTWR